MEGQNGLVFQRAKHFRSVLPVYPPPVQLLEAPKLPSPHREPAFDAPYILSTHLLPASYLRTTPFIPLPPTALGNTSKSERQKITERAFDYLVKANGIPDRRLDAQGHPQILWNCVNRYVRKSDGHRREGGLTLFLAHATGMTKETWEPMLGKLLVSEAGLLIDEVWAWESIQHGDAGLINASAASGSFDWTDNARDILNFLLHFVPRKATKDALPLHLKQIPEKEAHERAMRGYRDRRVVVIGHSFGATSSSLAACLFPGLFETLVLVDPIMFDPSTHDYVDRNSSLLYGALSRRNEWPSREAAFTAFLANPFFRAWDIAALRVHVETALYTTRSGTVRLKIPGAVEATVFVDYYTSQEVFKRIPCLDEGIPLFWILPGKAGGDDMGGSMKRVRLRPENSAYVKVKEAGHLIPQEAPARLAEELRTYLVQSFGPNREIPHALRLKSNL